jgi:hypothetical protein
MKSLYWTNPDVYEIEVEVKSVDSCKATAYPIVLHPDEGGRSADRSLR